MKMEKTMDMGNIGGFELKAIGRNNSGEWTQFEVDGITMTPSQFPAELKKALKELVTDTVSHGYHLRGFECNVFPFAIIGERKPTSSSGAHRIRTAVSEEARTALLEFTSQLKAGATKEFLEQWLDQYAPDPRKAQLAALEAQMEALKKQLGM